MLRIGVDIGGTKTELVAIDERCPAENDSIVRIGNRDKNGGLSNSFALLQPGSGNLAAPRVAPIHATEHRCSAS